jgi:hypothetical protein
MFVNYHRNINFPYFNQHYIDYWANIDPMDKKIPILFTKKSDGIGKKIVTYNHEKKAVYVW